MKPQSMKNQSRDKKRRYRQKSMLFPTQGMKKYVKHYRIKSMRQSYTNFIQSVIV